MPQTALVKCELFQVRQIFSLLGFSGLISVGGICKIVANVRKSDIVHISYAREIIPLLAAVVAILFGKRIIIQPHGMMTARKSYINSLVDIVALPVLRRADSIISLTKRETSDIRELTGVGENMCFELGNPLPTGLSIKMNACEGRGVQALFLSRLHPRKRLRDFIGAAQIAAANGWVDQYRVVGPDEGDLNQIEQAACRNLHYEGAIGGDKVADRVDQCDVFVMVSENEPWGNVLATALALGKPVVVTKSSAIASSVSSFNAGIVVDDRNPAAVADAVHRILSDTALYSKLAFGANRYSSEHLLPEAQQKNLLRAYARVGKML
ncbi:hypothetical protein ABM90_17165 [Rhodococcus erythropolis]|nr:hypothetical protein ABM90_17165 [Rhodococcus erythropolis]